MLRFGFEGFKGSEFRLGLFQGSGTEPDRDPRLEELLAKLYRVTPQELRRLREGDLPIQVGPDHDLPPEPLILREALDEGLLKLLRLELVDLLQLS